MTHADSLQSMTALGFFSQARPHKEQCSGTIFRSVSQPFAWWVSQSPKPVEQTITPHCLDELHDAMEVCGRLHGVQLFAPQP
jgi:hypothetical protein